MKKRLLATILTLVMVLSLLPVTALADGGEDDGTTLATSGTCGATENDSVTWNLEQNNEGDESPTCTLTISGDGAMADCPDSEQPWKVYREQISSVIIEEGVTHIGKTCFQHVLAETISIPSTVVSMDEFPFGAMKNLASITVAEGNPAYQSQDGVLLTKDGTMLIKYPSKKTSTSYSVPAGVLVIAPHALSYAESLTTITLPDGLQKIGRYAIQGTSVVTLTIPDSVTEMENYALFDSSTLQTVTIGSGITKLENYLFSKDTALTMVTFKKPDAIKEIGKYVFQSCSSLANLNLEDVPKVGANAFAGCTSLTALPVGFDTEVESFPLGTTKAVTTIKVPDSCTALSASAFNGWTSLIEISFSENSKLATIGSNAVRSTGLTYFRFPSTVKTVEDYAFQDNPYLHSVDMTELSDDVTFSSATFYYSPYFDSTAEKIAKIYYVPNSTLYEKVKPQTQSNYAIYAITNGGTFPSTTEFEADKLAEPSKTGWIFQGWYSDSNCTEGKEVTEGTDLSTNTTYYAKWEECTAHVSGETVTENEIAATCTTDGSYDSVVYCTKCGAEISRETTIIPATGHTWDNGVVTKAATCTEDGVRTYTCTVCGETKPETIPATGHNLTHVEAKEATYAAAGNIEYWYCNTCDKYFSDEAGTKEITEADTVIPKLMPPAVPGVPAYSVTAPAVDNGTVKADRTSASKGTTVTVTVAPKDGYELSGLTVRDANGNRVPLTQISENKFTFTMPASKVTVSAQFSEIKQEPAPWTNPYSDVKTTDWYYDAVQYVTEHGLMGGYNGIFAPTDATSRSMIVTILYGLEGEPAVSGTTKFNDVDAGSWYENAVAWAAANGIMGGYGNGIFGINDAITRQDLATTLLRYAKYKGYDVSAQADLSGYTDASAIASYALEAMRWANAEGLINGANAVIGPNGNAERAMAAAILMRFCENVEK